MDKFQKLFDSIIEILNWAEYQGHIKENQKEILEENITNAKEEIEKE